MIPKRSKQSETVLVVDDDPDALEEMTEALRDYGLTVHPAADGAQALLLADQHKPAFVLMDYNLPGIDGLETASALRRFLPHATVIMMSGLDDFCRVATTENTGTFAILKKPLTMNSIARYIRNRLDYVSAGNLNVTDLLTT